MRKVYLLFLLLAATTTFCQEKDSTYKYWMTFGFFVDKEMTLNADYSFSLGNNFYKVGYLKEGDSFPFGTIHADPDKYFFRSISTSIGKRFQSEWFQASAFCGPSYLFGEKGININQYKNFNAVGLEAEIQLLFRFANEFGIGIGLHGNLNYIKNFGGININLTLGNGK
jgi:hypothetical protein